MTDKKVVFKGMVPPIVTPLLAYDKLDEEGIKNLLESLIAGGVGGVFLLGSIGEFPSFSLALRIEFVQLCCKIVAGRIPVLVGVTDPAFSNSVDLAAACKTAGADALVVSPPFYFPLEQSETIAYIERVLEAVELPIMVYNIPEFTKVWLKVETLDYLTKYPQIIGVKDSCGDMDYFTKVCALKAKRPDWSILMGLEYLLFDAVKAGADGGVFCGCNIIPKLFVEAYEAAIGDDEEKKVICKKRIDALYPLYGITSPGFRLLAATKCALALKKVINSDFMNEPFATFTDEEKAKAQAVLDTLEG